MQERRAALAYRNKNYEKENKEFGLTFYASCGNTADNILGAEAENNQNRYDGNCNRQISSALVVRNIR